MPYDLKAALLEAYAINERINQELLAAIDERAWRFEPAGKSGRTIAAVFAHIHNVRHMWLTTSAKSPENPDKLDRLKCTPAEVKSALARSAERCSKMLAEVLERPDGKIKNFRPGVGPFLGYLIAHDAHHRGQISMLARQAGYPLSQETQIRLWEWAKFTELRT